MKTTEFMKNIETLINEEVDKRTNSLKLILSKKMKNC